MLNLYEYATTTKQQKWNVKWLDGRFLKKICNIPSMISSYTVNAQASLGGLLTTFLYSKSAEGLY